MRLTAFAIIGAVVVIGPVAAQAPPATPAVIRAGGNIRTTAPRGPVPRLADGTPDLTGVWLGGSPYGNIGAVLPKGETVPLLPQARALMTSRRANEDPGANCLPITVPRGTPYPWRLVVTPTHAFFLYEMYGYRQVFMDGRPHPADLDPTWHGHSVGRWEGDTLVIDTVGYNDKGWLDSRGHPRTEKAHTIERFTRTDLGTLSIEVTIDDPGAYAKPFTLAFTARLMPQGELLEYICAENNQDVPHIEGPANPERR
jgi:hypothetical protein